MNVRKEIRENLKKKDFDIPPSLYFLWKNDLLEHNIEFTTIFTQEFLHLDLEFPYVTTLFQDLDPLEIYDNIDIDKFNDYEKIPNKELEKYIVNFKNTFKTLAMKSIILNGEENIFFPLNNDYDFPVPNSLADFYIEHERVKCKKIYKEKSPYESWSNFKVMKKVVDYIVKNNNRINLKSLRDGLFFVSSECRDFKITVALNLLKYFNPKKWLDFSAGWGSRLISAMFWNKYTKGELEYYVGIDPSETLHKSYEKMINDLNTKLSIGLISLPYEEVPDRTIINLTDGKPDFIFTSPPFFDLEVFVPSWKENAKEQSIEKFNNLADWTVNFLIYSLLKSFDLLEVGGYMVINIEDINVVDKLGGEKHYVEAAFLTLYLLRSNSYFKGIFGFYNDKNKGRENIVRPLYVWQKRKEMKTLMHSTFLINALTELHQNYPNVFNKLKKENNNFRSLLNDLEN